MLPTCPLHPARALEYLAQAEEEDPGAVPTAMLRLSAHLETGGGEGATSVGDRGRQPGLRPEIFPPSLHLLALPQCGSHNAHCTHGGATG